MDIKRTVHGVGYNSGGKHIVSIKKMRTHTYMTWYNMMTRCYSAKLHEKHPQYSVCEVDEAWHDFQVFAEWYESHEFSGLGYHVDKDLLISRNVNYGQDYCCLLPQEINKMIVTSRNRLERLHGAFWNKKAKVWVAALNIKNKQVHLGSFSREIDAHEVYIKAKESLVRNAAKDWKGRIEKRAFEALSVWECP